MWSKSDKKQLWLYCAIALGGPLLLFLLYLGFGANPNITLFSRVVVLLPAFAAITCNYTTKREKTYPKRFYIFFSLVFFITLAGYFVELFTAIPFESSFVSIIECSLAALGLVILAFEPREAKVKYGLAFFVGKGTVVIGVIVLFIALYFIRLIPVYVDPEYIKNFTAQLDQKALLLLYLPFLFFIAYLPFWGEEYGWRYCLLPLLQKKFGCWIGTLISVFLWGVWHIPMLIVSNAGDDILSVGLVQIAFCICLGFFLAFAKEVSNNIWLVAFLHYLNNQFAVFVAIDLSTIGKINATAFSDALVMFIFNIIYILPFLVYRLYLWQKNKGALAN